ncbi:MAG: hypothetical protein HOQ31_09255 [Gemmatimonadaceae bacterium]|nr:hypothetical protein [Gemmatimonadaceae bacterium]NUP71815.1 hypothetical protein [Gemmatimonadaceae bacterium]
MREFVAHVRTVIAATTFVLGVSVAAPSAAGQVVPHLDLGGDVEVAGEAERYLRVLQLTGSVPLLPWTVLPFAGEAIQRVAPMGAHPWDARFPTRDSTRAIHWLRPTAVSTVNSAFPMQDAVGPMWSGRGVNLSVQAGVSARWGRLRAQFAPIAFVSQNVAFPLAPNLQVGDAQFRDARFPTSIDLPQRFGASSYSRVDLGSSTIALDLRGVSLGVSTAPQRWGPAREYPLLLGPGAGGFPHAFIGTGLPVDLKIARVQARLLVGSLSQSQFSPALPERAGRVASAAIIGVTPGGVDGLEVGFARFFESTDPLSLMHVLRPLDPRALVGAVGNPAADVNIPNENQTAAAFFRWAVPDGRVEAYGELYREDFPGDLRKLILKPDDLTSFTLGFQRVFTVTPTQRRLVRIELVDGELSHQERGQRGADRPIPPYLHFQVVQGHTQRGLLLGSPEAFGGSGWRVAVDDYTPRGRVTVGIERALRFDWLPGDSVPATNVHPDVLYALRLEMLRFAGRRDYTLVLVPAIDLNRDLRPGADQFNLHAGVRVTGW